MSSQYPVYNNKPIDQWKVTELKEELRRRKLKIHGLKEELVRRLDESLRSEMTEAPEEELGNDSDPDSDPQNNVDGKHAKENSEQLSADNDADEFEDHSKKVDATMVDVDDSTLDVNQRTEGYDQKEIDDATADVAVKDMSEDAVPVDSVTVDQNLLTEGYDQKDIGDATANVAVNDTSEDTVLVHSDTDDQNLLTRLKPDNQEASYDENAKVSKPLVEDVVVEAASDDALPVHSAMDDQNALTKLHDQEASYVEKTKVSKPPAVDVEFTLPETTNQVSEVSPDLGFQVKSQSISTDYVSINEKNELKDNLNANNVHLELEVVKAEMVQPSSSDVPTIGVDLHPLEDDKELVDNHGSLEKVGEVTCTTEMELCKKIDSVDGGSPEKLNLERSSGDESMEEDVLESKQIESKNYSDEVGDRSEDTKVEVAQVANPADAMVGGLPPEDTFSEGGTKLTVPVEKRKAKEQEAVAIEPKRRRWNSETIKVPESQTSNVTATPKDVFQPSLRRSFTRTNSSLSGEASKERVVPPPLGAATTSLRINNFLRPFTLKALQELLGKTGTFSDFWMDHIKTHCYVTYSSIEEAVATRNALYNLQWPTNGGRLLTAEFVDPQEVKSRLETLQSSAPVTPSPTAPAASPFQPQPQAQAQAVPPPRNPLRQQLLPPPPPLPPPPALTNPPPAREQLPPPPPPPKQPKPPIVTLDDLFKKTKATPRIYYLPLSEEQVAERLIAQGKRAQEGQ